MSCMKKTSLALIAFLLSIPLMGSALEPTSPGIRGNRNESLPVESPSVRARPLSLDFWYQSPTDSLGLVDAITKTVSWQPLQKFRTSGSPDSFFPCRFTFRCTIDNRTIKYCNVMTDNRASYRMSIDVEGQVHVSVDGPGRQSISFDAEGYRKRIQVYGRTDATGASCGIEP